jgi:hypothetical protein
MSELDAFNAEASMPSSVVFTAIKSCRAKALEDDENEKLCAGLDPPDELAISSYLRKNYHLSGNSRINAAISARDI